MYRSLNIILIIALYSVTAVAEDELMVRLFRCQVEMANSGSVEAVMKLGEMYEEGTGTKQDLSKALEMYRQAQAGGKKEAALSIKRVERKTKDSLKAKEIAKRYSKENIAQGNAARDKAGRGKITGAKATRVKTARDRLVREKLARVKVAREKVAREKAAPAVAAKLKLQREKAARAKAAKINVELAKKTRVKVAKGKTVKNKAPIIKMQRNESGRKKTVINGFAREKIKVVKIKPENVIGEQTIQVWPLEESIEETDKDKEYQKTIEDAKNEDGFSSNPCDSPAARLMSNCRKK